MKKAYILFTDTSSVLSKCIKLHTKKTYNHASISFTPDLNEVFSFGRKKPWNPFIGGFSEEDVSTGLFKQANCLLYSLTVTDKEFLKMKQYVEEVKSEKELYTYNLIGLVGVANQISIEREHAFFCSQFVATVLNKSGYIYFEKPLSLVTPTDLEDTLDLEVIYEGSLQGYLNATLIPKIVIQI